MSSNPNQVQTDNALLGEQSSASTLTYSCPVCKTEYNKGEANCCSVCNWDLTPCPEAFVERQNVHIAWAKEIWLKLQALEQPLPTKINAQIDTNPQLSELREESNSEIWDLLITWVSGVDLVAAKAAVRRLQEKYQGKEPCQISHILIVQKSFQVAGLELVKGIGVGKLLNELARVDLPTIAPLLAEMVYQIAAIYGLDLQAPQRKLEVLAVFGLAFLGEQAFSAGIDWMKYGLALGMVLSASAKGLMIYAVGNAACLFYEAQVNQSIEPLKSPEVFKELRQESQNYLEFATSEEAIINIISSEIEIAPIIIPPPKPVKKTRKAHHNSPNKQRKDNDKYKRLRSLLAAGNLREADGETNNKIFELMETYLNLEASLTEEHIKKIPYQDLHTIDMLWKKYSKGRFGFSAQRQIYQTMTSGFTYRAKKNPGFFSQLLGNDMERVYVDKQDKLCDSVGWRRISWGDFSSEFTFSLKAPTGHLPSFTKYAQQKGQLEALFNRVTT